MKRKVKEAREGLFNIKIRNKVISFLDHSEKEILLQDPNSPTLTWYLLTSKEGARSNLKFEFDCDNLSYKITAKEDSTGNKLETWSGNLELPENIDDEGEPIPSVDELKIDLEDTLKFADEFVSYQSTNDQHKNVPIKTAKAKLQDSILKAQRRLDTKYKL